MLFPTYRLCSSLGRVNCGALRDVPRVLDFPQIASSWHYEANKRLCPAFEQGVSTTDECEAALPACSVAPCRCLFTGVREREQIFPSIAALQCLAGLLASAIHMLNRADGSPSGKPQSGRQPLCQHSWQCRGQYSLWFYFMDTLTSQN